MRSFHEPFAVFWLIFAAMLAPRAAQAQAHPAPDAEAVAFFDEGRRLMTESNFKGAALKFEESLRHARSVGALLNLGRCYEELGRHASAWATYRAAAALARELRDAREQTADRFATNMRPKVSVLALDTHAIDDVAGVEVKRDGVVVGAGARAEAAPVDPGEHVVEVTAPGKKKWIGKVQVEANGTRAQLRIERLEDAAPSPKVDAHVDARATTAPPSSTPRTLGAILAGVGGAGIAAGVITGLMAMSKHRDAVNACSSYPNHCNSDGAADSPNEASQSFATASTVSFIAGGAAFATGIVLLLTAPHGEAPPEPRTGVRVAPLFVARGAGVGVGGAW